VNHATYNITLRSGKAATTLTSSGSVTVWGAVAPRRTTDGDLPFQARSNRTAMMEAKDWLVFLCNDQSFVQTPGYMPSIDSSTSGYTISPWNFIGNNSGSCQITHPVCLIWLFCFILVLIIYPRSSQLYTGAYNLSSSCLLQSTHKRQDAYPSIDSYTFFDPSLSLLEADRASNSHAAGRQPSVWWNQHDTQDIFSKAQSYGSNIPPARDAQPSINS